MTASYQVTKWNRPTAITALCNAVCTIFLVGAVFANSQRAESAVVNTTGNVLLIAPPASVVLGSLENSSLVKLFAERTNQLLGANILVDVTTTGVVDESADLTPGQLAANTLVDSYLLHADPIGRGSPVVMYQGTVTFDAPILGAMVTATRLSATDGILGSVSTVYTPATIYRGFEGPGFPETADVVRDSLEISPDFRTVTFVLRATSQYDQIRIFTASVPEPSALLLATLAVPFALRRVRR